VLLEEISVILGDQLPLLAQIVIDLSEQLKAKLRELTCFEKQKAFIESVNRIAKRTAFSLGQSALSQALTTHSARLNLAFALILKNQSENYFIDSLFQRAIE
jgi:hypothetical protein